MPRWGEMIQCSRKQASGVPGSCSHGQCMASHKVSRVLLQIPTIHACFPNIAMENTTIYQEKNGRFSMAMLVYRRVIFYIFFEMLKTQHKFRVQNGGTNCQDVLFIKICLCFLFLFWSETCIYKFVSRTKWTRYIFLLS